MPSLLVASSLLSSLALAADPVAPAELPTAVAAAQQRVKESLVDPLNGIEMENAAFSRRRVTPKQRQVRMTALTASADASGKTFYPFALDVRFGKGWKENDVLGCVYADGGEVYVQRGDTWRPASFLLGKRSKPVDGVCVAAGGDQLAAK